MNEIKAGSEDDRLHGSTSARLRSLCRDNKTNLHTGQLAPGRMSRVCVSRAEHFPRMDERSHRRSQKKPCIKNLLTAIPVNRRYLPCRCVGQNCAAKKAIKMFLCTSCSNKIDISFFLYTEIHGCPLYLMSTWTKRATFWNNLDNLRSEWNFRATATAMFRTFKI